MWQEEGTPEVPHFWQRSCQLDAYLRFAKIASKVWKDKTDFWTPTLTAANGMLNSTQAWIQKCLNQKWWTDDYGWTGIACIKASEYCILRGDSAQAVIWCNMAIQCFENMASLWDDSVSAKPIIHGVANGFVKNTVTNADFFAFCMQLYQFLNTNRFIGTSTTRILSLKYAYKQYLWFNGWNNTGIGPDIPGEFYHNVLTPTFTCRMIEERPLTTGDVYTYPEVFTPPGEPGATWSGDQGLYINACATLYNNLEDLKTLFDIDIEPIRTDLKSTMTAVTQGVFHMLCSPPKDPGDGAKDGVIREAPFSILMDGGYNPDYLAGRGVLCRFLNDDDTRKALNDFDPTLIKLFNEIFLLTAKAIQLAQNLNPSPGQPTGQISANWGTPANTTLAYTEFVKWWKFGDTSLSWDDASMTTNRGWQNYCQMNAFDALGAYLTSQFIVPQGKTNGVFNHVNGAAPHGRLIVPKRA
jgi:hypothetical protein